MVRSKWKNKLLLKKKINLNKNIDQDIVIFDPNFLILKEYVGKKFSVYEGNLFCDILITEDMVGFNLSTLITTRFNNGSIHDKKNQKKNKKK